MKTKDNQMWFVDHDNEVYLENREDFDTYLTKEDLLEMLKAIEENEQGSQYEERVEHGGITARRPIEKQGGVS